MAVIKDVIPQHQLFQIRSDFNEMLRLMSQTLVHNRGVQILDSEVIDKNTKKILDCCY